MGENLSISSGSNQTKVELPFERGKHLFSSRCSEAYEATLKADSKKCIVWMLRYPLSQENTKSFTERLEKIKKLNLSSAKIINSNVESNGVVYLVLENEKLVPLLDSTWIPVELEEKFLAVLKTVEVLHRAGIVLGDISEHSFLLNESNSISLGALLGDFDFAAQNTAQLPPAQVLAYVAPERSLTARADISSDIYGLGVFAYRLFTGQYPKTPVEKPSSFRSDLPTWVDAVIGTCLQADPAKRFKEVSNISKIIQDSIKSGKAPELSGLWPTAKPENIEKLKETKELVKVKPKQTEAAKEKSVPSVAVQQNATLETKRNTVVWLFALIMGFSIAGFVFLSIGTTNNEKKTEPIKEPEKVVQDTAVSDPIAFIAEYAPAELKELIIKLADSETDNQQKLTTLRKINESQDPVAFEVLVAVLQSNYDNLLKTQAKKSIIERLDLQGMSATSGLMQDWINFQSQLSPASVYIFRAIDQARPARSRVASLLDASSKDLVLALRFAASLAIDESEPAFIESLRNILSKQAPGEDFSNKGIGALLVSHPSLSMFLNRDIAKTLSKFTNEDLTWSLLKAAEGDQPILKELAQEVVRRNIFSPIEMVFIGVLVKEIPVGQSSHVYDRELILAAMGKIQSSDLYNFARWDSLEAEKVLLAICATSPDAGVVKEAFDILAAKSLQNKLAENFITWIKSGFWEYRTRMAKSVAVISLTDLAAPQEIEKALDNLMPFAKGGLFRVISSSDDAILIKEALGRMGALLSSEDLLQLLTSKNKEIRIEAVRGLKGRNELEVLKEIVKAYDAEKDLEVRKVYNEVHWVTKNRKGF